MKEKETVKGYKAFRPGFYCEHDGNRKQYYENSVAEDKGAAGCCREGVMHFCENPLDCLDYYPLITDDGKFTEFAPVKALDEVYRKDNKCATRKLKIGAKLSFKDFIKASVDVIMESTRYAVNADANSDNGGYGAQIGSSGNYAKIGSSGDGAQIGSSGNYAQIGSCGDGAQIGSSGYGAKIGSSGYGAQIGSCGDGAQIDASGKDSVVSAIGANSIAKAAVGCWIVLAEHGKWNGSYYPVKCVRTAQVDGATIKPDTWYKLENGEFVEAREEE